MLLNSLDFKPLDRHARLLITGAGGVLGQAVTAHFKQEGFTQLLTPSRSEMNLLDAESTHHYFAKHQPQAVIHLAAVVFGLGGNLKFKMRAVLENTTINNNFFFALQQYPVKRLFFASTVAAYGFPYRNMPLAETDFFNGFPHEGEFGYGMAKRHAYTYLRLLTEEVGTHCTYGIFTNMYGPYDRFDSENGHVIPSLIAKSHQAAITGNALEVWGNGHAERDFLYADDAARAVLLCLEHNQRNRVINISSGQGVNIRYISETLAAIAGVKKINFAADKPIGISRRVVDNQQLTQLGFNPSISIEEGLAKTYRWYISNLENIRK